MINEPKKSAPLWPAWISLIVIIVWCCNFFYGMHTEGSVSGQFGDSFGAVNALFSGLAFSGVFYAIFLQRYEVELTKFELERTKTILEEQQKNIHTQNINFKKQAFENTFFQMLSIFNEITEKINYDRSGNFIGKNAFPRFVRSLTENFTATSTTTPMEYYESFYSMHNAKLGHYFRMLFNIINFIDKSDIEDKVFYVKLVRAQISNAEVALLFFNGLSNHGKNSFKILIEKYGLLKNLNDNDIVSSTLKEKYVATAFGKAKIN